MNYKDFRDLVKSYETVYNPSLREEYFYNKEVEELSENIFYQITLSMISEGSTFGDVLNYFAEEETDNIWEKYLNCKIKENIVTEEFLDEQLYFCLTEAPNIIPTPLSRILSGQAQTTVPSGARRVTRPPQGSWEKIAQGGMELARGGVRNVLGGAIVGGRVLASKLPGGSGASRTVTQLAGGAKGTGTETLKAAVKKQGEAAIQGIKKNVVPALVKGGAALAGGAAYGEIRSRQGYDQGYNQGQSAADKEYEKLRQQAGR